MKRHHRFGLLFGAFALAGCGGSGGGVKAPAEVPLTVAEWNGMPADRKYQAETFERLKLGEAKFKDEKAWDQFYRTTVVPNRKKETAAVGK